MLEFKILEALKPNTELLELIKDYRYKVKKGKIKHPLHTNLQVIKFSIMGNPIPSQSERKI